MKLKDLTSKTTDQIQAMSNEQLANVIWRMSRAANKRLDTLASYAYKRNSEFIEKKGGPGLDLGALNQNSRRFGKIGANAKHGSLTAEYTRVKNFLNAESTTVKGAIALRKQKERELFGETREMTIYKQGLKEGRKLTKAEQDEIKDNRNEFMTQVYEQYHKWREEYAMEGGYTKEQGKESLGRIGSQMSKGLSGGLARYNESRRLDKQYEKKKLKAAESEEQFPSSLKDKEYKDE